MFVQYICAQVVFSVDLLEAVKVIDEYSFENVLRHPVAVLRIKHRQKQERVTNTLLYLVYWKNLQMVTLELRYM
jgi:hypothetical protein